MIYLAIFGSQQLLGWPIVRIWGASPWGYSISADLASVLNSATCLKTLPFENYFSVGFGDCAYIYGNVLIFLLNALSVTAASTSWLSWVFLVIAAMIFSDLTVRFFERVEDKPLRLAGFLAFCSPPIALLLERANFDVIIFALVYLAVIALARNRWILATAALALSILMKFYSIFALAISFVVRPKRKKYVWILLAIFALVLGEILIEVAIRKPSIPVDIGGAFGAHSIGLWFNFTTKFLSVAVSLPNSISLVIGWLAIGAAVLVLGKIRKTIPYLLRDLRMAPQIGNTSQTMGVMMGLIFFGCYLAGANFDYRLVFFMPFALTLIANATVAKNRRILGILMFLAMWLSYDSGVIGQIIGDGVLIIWSALAFLSVYSSLENGFPKILRLPKYEW